MVPVTGKMENLQRHFTLHSPMLNKLPTHNGVLTSFLIIKQTEPNTEYEFLISTSYIQR